MYNKPKVLKTKRTNEKLWQNIVKSVKKGSKGGLAGQWSARKAQLAVKMYVKKGGRYSSKKSKNNSLHKWSKQNWRTKSGRPSVLGKNASGERYLPYNFIKKMSSKDYKESSKLKKRAIRQNKQYSKQNVKIQHKLSKYLKNN